MTQIRDIMISSRHFLQMCNVIPEVSNIHFNICNICFKGDHYTRLPQNTRVKFGRFTLRMSDLHLHIIRKWFI